MSPSLDPEFDINGYTEANLGIASAVSMATMQWLRANTLFTLRAAFKAFNAAQVAIYKAAFAQYKASRDERPDVVPAQPAPEPAFALIVVKDQYGNPVQGASTERVCPTETYVPPPKVELGHGKVGKFVFTDMDTGEDWFMWLPGDTTLPGKLVHAVSADGIEGLFVKQRALQGSGAGVTTTVNGYYIRKG